MTADDAGRELLDADQTLETLAELVLAQAVDDEDPERELASDRAIHALRAHADPDEVITAALYLLVGLLAEFGAARGSRYAIRALQQLVAAALAEQDDDQADQQPGTEAGHGC